MVWCVKCEFQSWNVRGFEGLSFDFKWKFEQTNKSLNTSLSKQNSLFISTNECHSEHLFGRLCLNEHMSLNEGLCLNEQLFEHMCGCWCLNEHLSKQMCGHICLNECLFEHLFGCLCLNECLFKRTISLEFEIRNVGIWNSKPYFKGQGEQYHYNVQVVALFMINK